MTPLQMMLSYSFGGLPPVAALGILSSRFTVRAPRRTQVELLSPTRLRAEASKLMRWKLLILASLIAAIAGVGLACAVILVGYGSLRDLATHNLPFSLTLTIPLVMVTLAGFFVYRHTARRRKLQTTLAVLLTFFLTVAAFALGSILTPRLYLPLMTAPQSK
ncbi:MAG: hypothetical protein ABI596_17715 [Pyrinomonadaceae bacterium]